MSKIVKRKGQIVTGEPCDLQEYEESLFGVLADLVTRPLPQDQWHEIRETAWVEGSHFSLQADENRTDV